MGASIEGRALDELESESGGRAKTRRDETSRAGREETRLRRDETRLRRDQYLA